MIEMLNPDLVGKIHKYDYLTVKQVASITEANYKTILKYIHLKKLNAKKIGYTENKQRGWRWIIKPNDVISFLKAYLKENR